MRIIINIIRGEIERWGEERNMAKRFAKQLIN